MTIMQNCEGMRATEAVERYANFLLAKVPMKGHPSANETLEAPDCFGIYRCNLADSNGVIDKKDNGKFLGSVGGGFEITQPLDDLVRYQPAMDAGLLKLNKVGLLSDGRIFVAEFNYGKIKSKADVVVGDTIEQGFRTYTGLAGNKGYGATSWIKRLVCLNGAARVNDGRSINFKHTRSINIKLDQLAQVFESHASSFDETIEAYRHLARKEIKSDKQVKDYVDQVFEVNRTEKVSTKLDNKVRYVCSLFDTQIGKELVTAPSYWKAYNAVTQYLTHDHGHNEDNRLDSLMFGESAKVSQRALSLALNA